MSAYGVALYARVSSDQQSQDGTIESQLATLRERITQESNLLLPDYEFIDQGYSGSSLVRPALERLRDAAAAGEIERLYVHSPDRLARKYAYQVMLLDELTRAGVEVVFLNRALGESPEDELLLQVQGMIVEYERAKILERSRRGKRHKAQQGSINVLGGAPYGYLYVTLGEGAGRARYEIVEEQAQVVRQVFDWVGNERLSIGEVARRLKAAAIPSPKGWDRSSLWGMLKNPAYMGQAAFGKTRAGELRPRLREQRGRSLQPRRARASYDTPADTWLSIPVPPIVSEALFALVEAQLEENQRRARQGQRGTRYLLQGLLVCRCCGYAYYGKPISPSGRKGHVRSYAYYRCTGSDAYRFGGERLCFNTQVRTDRLEQAVWHEVCRLLEDPERLVREYQRRLDEIHAPPQETKSALLAKRIAKVEQGIARLIDPWLAKDAEGYISKEEFEPRIRRFKERLEELNAQANHVRERAHQETELTLVIGRLEEFSVKVRSGLEDLDWAGRRELIRTLVKRVDIDKERINVVFRIEGNPALPPGNNPFLQHCWGRDDPSGT